MTTTEQKMIRIGVIGKTHGIAGELRFYPDVEDANTIETIAKLRLKTAKSVKTFNLKSVKKTDTHYIIKLEDIDSATLATPLVNAVCYVQREELSPLDSGNYACDLIGFKLLDDNDAFCGIVRNFWNNGFQDILVFESPTGNECMVPYVDGIIGEISLEQKFLRVDGEIVRFMSQVDDETEENDDR